MKENVSLHRKLIWGGIFAITMGYFEAALVEYLRELYYPEGFSFPLADFPPRLLLIELGREVASVLMLVSVGVLLGSSFIDRFAGFAYCFGLWDISYYLFLKIFENWPPSLATMDVLFLIPSVWIGPVWAPIGVSIALIWASYIIWRRLARGKSLRPTTVEWTLEILSGLIIIISFLWGAPAAIHKETLPYYPWWLWLFGMVLGAGIFLRTLHRSDKIESQ